MSLDGGKMSLEALSRSFRILDEGKSGSSQGRRGFSMSHSQVGRACNPETSDLLVMGTQGVAAPPGQVSLSLDLFQESR